MNEAQPGVVSAEPAGVERPLWSVMIPTYNCAGYLRETLASVLAQDPGPERMQIEVVDDHSTRDDPERVVREVGKGRVGFFRQPRNMGHVANFNSCLQRARGELVHLLHGDDRVRQGFYRAMQLPFQEHPEIGAAFCRYIAMDEQGHWMEFARPERSDAGLLGPQWLERIATGQRLQTPCMVVRRTVYEHLGGFDPRLRRVGEDWEMWVRIAARYPIWYEPSPLAEYRRHTQSLTGLSIRTGEDMRDLRCVVEINRGHLSGHESCDRVIQRARQWCASQGLETARRAAVAGEWTTVRTQLRESIRSSATARTVVRAGLVLAYAAVQRFRVGRARSSLQSRSAGDGAPSSFSAQGSDQVVEKRALPEPLEGRDPMEKGLSRTRDAGVRSGASCG